MAVDAGSAVGYLDLDISGFLAGLKSAQSEADTASKNIATKIGNNLQGAGKSMTSVGSTLTAGLTAPLTAAGATAFKFSSEFESAMAQVATIADPAAKSISAISGEITNLSNDTGMAASDLAAATYQAISAGVDTASSVQFVADASKLATAGFTDTTTAVDALTTIINAYGLSAEDATHISDVLISTQNKGKTTVDELASTMGKVIPTANAMNVSLEDLGTAYSYLTAGGIATAESTTYLNGMFNELGKSGTTVSNVLKERTGKSFQELMEGGTSLREVLSVLEDEANEAGVGFNDLWGSQEAGKAALALLNTSTEKYNATLKDFQTTVGDTEDAYGTMADTTKYKLNVAMQNGKNALIQIGDTIKTMLLPFLEKGIEALQKLNDWLSSLSDGEKEQIVKIAAVVAAAGPVLMVFGKLTSSVGSIITTFGKIPGVIKAVTSGFTKLTTAGKNIFEGFKLAKAGFTALGAQASPLGAALAGVTAPMIAIVAAVALVTAAFVSLWKNNEEFRNKMIAIWDGIKSKFESFAQGIVDRLNALGFDFENFGEVVKAIWDGFCSVLAPIFEAAFEIISNVLGTVLDVLTGLLDVFIGLFTGNWEQMWTGIKEIASSIWNGISSLFKSISETLLGSLKTWGSNMINSAKNSATNFLNNVSNVIRQLPGKIAEYLRQVISKVTSWVKDMGTKGKQAAQNMFNSVKNGLSKLPSTMLSIGKNVVQGLWNGISGAANWLYRKVSSFVGNIVGTIKDALGINSPSTVMRDKIGKWLPPGIGEGFKVALPDTMDDIKNQFNTNIDKLRGKLHTLQVTGAEVSGGVDFNFDEFDTGRGSFDYKTLAEHLAEVLKGAPIQVPVNVEMQDGDIIMDSERVGRKVAPVVSRVVVQGL